MKTDYRIMGRPFRGTRIVVCVRSGFATREEALSCMRLEQESGTMDPHAFVRAQRVSDNYDPIEAEKKRRCLLF
jgi:hypothetical protein